MTAILLKEINAFFSSVAGYLVVGLFLLMTSLFLWVFDGKFNMFDYGYADLTPFFQLAPWIFIFLIPAVTMRSFSEELRAGTLELLLTKPITSYQLVLGKFFGSFLLLIIALLPTLFYVYAIDALGNPAGNYDAGVVVGSYLGLLFMGSAFTAIGILASALSSNQIVAFISALLMGFALYYGMDALPAGWGISGWSMSAHFESMARGVLDTRDLIYFCSVTLLFLFLTSLKLKSKR